MPLVELNEPTLRPFAIDDFKARRATRLLEQRLVLALGQLVEELAG